MFQTRIVHQQNRRALYASLLIHTALIGILWSRSFISTIKRSHIQVVYAADWEPVISPIGYSRVKPTPTRPAVVTPVEVPPEIPAHITALTDIDVAPDLPESALEERTKSVAALIAENTLVSGPEVPGPPLMPNANKETDKDEPPSPEPPPPPPPPMRIGGHLQPAHLVHEVSPVYPPLARTGRIQGVVVIDAVITESGSLKEITVRSGHPILVSAAIDCVRQWKYQPAILNGVPVESPVHIQVKFRLQAPIAGD